MKKFIFMACLMSVVLTAFATQKADPPGPALNLISVDGQIATLPVDGQIATLSMDGQTVATCNQMWNIRNLQAPVMLNVEVSSTPAQVADEHQYAITMAGKSVALAYYQWPIVAQSIGTGSYTNYKSPTAVVSTFGAAASRFTK